MKLNLKNIIIVVIIVGVAGFAFIKFSKKGTFNSPENLVSNVINSGNSLVAVEDGIVPGEIKKIDEQNNTYIHKKYGFTFNYPSSMKTSNFKEGDGEEILFSSSNSDWFQIYITPWDEQDDISVARIKKDLPNILISDPQRVIIGPRQKEGIGPQALIFFSKDSGLGDTREVWFVQNGNLYQITTSKKLDLKLGQVLSTFTFN